PGPGDHQEHRGAPRWADLGHARDGSGHGRDVPAARVYHDVMSPPISVTAATSVTPTSTAARPMSTVAAPRSPRSSFAISLIMSLPLPRTGCDTTMTQRDARVCPVAVRR